VRAGDPVATVLRCDKLRFVGSVPEKDAHWIALGQKVRLQIRNENEPREAEVSRFQPQIDPMSRALIFEADVPNKGCPLRPGLFAEAEVIVDPDAETLVVPESAVFEFAGIEKVWRVTGGEAHEVAVETGGRRAGEVAIRSGLAAGEQVVVDATTGRNGKVIVTDESDS
jgi:RND family efflux transporter MFP subunit